MARLHGAIERDPAQHEKLIVRIKEILAQVARCVSPGPAQPGGCPGLDRLALAGPRTWGLALEGDSRGLGCVGRRPMYQVALV